MIKSIFYKPEDGVAADFIPFYWDGAFHLFYLKDYRDVTGHGEGTPWFHLVTRDFIHFEDWGESLPRGTKDEQDLYVFTGSVIANPHQEGDFRIFYTGHNPHFQDVGKPVQGVMQARSADLRQWRKDDWLFLAPTDQNYEPDDWRDPFVFWNNARQEFWMLLAARKNTGAPRHRGLTALASSPDLENWTVQAPLWAPDLYYTHECPDLFQMGDWWYLVYSTFSEKTVTHYRMSRDFAGAWIDPPDDQFDGRAFYAAKTASNGLNRYLFGWLATRSGENDGGEWNWGGNLVIHQLGQESDGSLTVDMPDSIRSIFLKPVGVQPAAVMGNWDLGSSSCSSASQSRFSVTNWTRLPDEAYVRLSILMAAGTASAGLLLRSASDLTGYYQVRLEPAHCRLVIDRWPRPGDQPFMLERRLIQPLGQPVELELLISGSCLVVYANHKVALSCRLYDHPVGNLGFFVAEGQAYFDQIIVNER